MYRETARFGMFFLNNEYTMPRNTSISIAKGLAIIAVVIGHAGAPGTLSYLMYAFHMPLFFITAGYFFNVKYLDREGEFIRRRIKGLYVPFVKWSLVFLLLYNLWFQWGVMNEQYGNAAGGLLHPYSLRQLLQNAISICVNMSGYDVCMAGAFWFFRALLVASVVFLLYYRFLARRLRMGKVLTTATVCLTALGMVLLCAVFGLRITGLPQGGYRDLMGIFFFGLGFLYRDWEPFLKQECRYWPMLLYAALLASWTFWHLPVGMPFAVRSPGPVLLMIPPAVAGFLLVHQVSKFIDRRPSLFRRFLIYCGNNTLYVFIFHFAVFKLVSLLKLLYYGMDYSRLGYYPVIHEHTDDWFWLLYSLMGVGLPLVGIYAWRRIKNNIYLK